ncbi:Glycosyl transferases group 1 [Azospirillum oryzae]|uniref:Glycosyl transferases group 1 n=1 Tax=Azospirillum oryzae TaxID=286727 RepID=A0A1X7EXU4_9PROT|nr:glycosyltransferase [Azospirillum oryzae]SMF42140.1 Glycosyl transferases group 1 [Azospirillum oryzae]
MRIAIYNPFGSQSPTAEKEITERIRLAAAARGWSAIAVHTSGEVEEAAPDVVLNLHPQQRPKLTLHPWLACFWNPVSFYEGHPASERHEMSHDGFLVSGPRLERYLRDIFFETPRMPPVAPFHCSSSGARLHPPALHSGSRLFYVGSNWDRARYRGTFGALAAKGLIAVHGPAERWDHLGAAYAGALPFNGRSVIDAAAAEGLGLCLHMPGHCAWAVPNMRVFELAAAGCLAVADRHPFLAEAFGDTLLYVDTGNGEEELADRIAEAVAFARGNPARGREMAAAAQEIFRTRFSLDVLLDGIPAILSALETAAGTPAETHPPSGGRHLDADAAGVAEGVEVILSAPSGREEAVARTLAGISAQTHGALSLTILGPAAPARIDATRFRRIRRLPGEPDGAALAEALAGLSEDWFAMPEPGCLWDRRHLSTLLATARRSGASLILAGALAGRRTPEPEAAGLSQGEMRLLRCLAPAVRWKRSAEEEAAPGALLAHRGLLQEEDLRDPGLTLLAAEFVAKRLCRRARIAPSFQVTACLPPKPETEEWERLGRLTRLAPPETEGMPERLLPATGLSDLNPAMAERLPRLETPADFRKLPQDKPIYIYGASRGGRLVHLELLKWEELTLRGFLDSNRSGEAWGLPLHRPQDLEPALLRHAVVLIASQFVSEILRSLSGIPDLDIRNAYPYIASH